MKEYKNINKFCVQRMTPCASDINEPLNLLLLYENFKIEYITLDMYIAASYYTEENSKFSQLLAQVCVSKFD